MKFKSPIFTQASGSIAGMTFSHNRGGLYTRARVIPVDPGSSFQMIVRGFVASLTSHWNNTLTAAQREAWDTYGLNVPMLNKLGEPINIGGLAHYVRSNVPRLQAALTRVDDGPTIFNLGEFTNPGWGNVSGTGGTGDLTFVNTDLWANETGGALLALAARGQNPSINYFKGPYRFMDLVAGDDTTPPTSPATMTLPFTLAENQISFVQIRACRADGRLALPFRTGSVVGA